MQVYYYIQLVQGVHQEYCSIHSIGKSGLSLLSSPAALTLQDAVERMDNNIITIVLDGDH